MRTRILTGVVIALLAVLVCGVIGSNRPAKQQAPPEAAGDLSTRASRRAFYMAPPVVPHKYGDEDRDCIYCHSKVREYDGKLTTVAPHLHFTNCKQCHVSAIPADGRPPVAVQTNWQGLAAPAKLERPHRFAPAVIPHPIGELRKNCGSCHNGKDPKSEAKGPHPERANCVQCHVAVRPANP